MAKGLINIHIATRIQKVVQTSSPNPLPLELSFNENENNVSHKL